MPEEAHGAKTMTERRRANTHTHNEKRRGASLASGELLVAQALDKLLASWNVVAGARRNPIGGGGVRLQHCNSA